MALSIGPSHSLPAAHEITHAFDDSGINYDAEGRAAQLYDNSTILGFHREAACLRDQYSTYRLAEAKVDGNLTLGENLADHGGLSMALEGYSAWRRENTDVRLPALPFDDLQLFFIGKNIIGSSEVAVSLLETFFKFAFDTVQGTRCRGARATRLRTRHARCAVTSTRPSGSAYSARSPTPPPSAGPSPVRPAAR